MDRRFHLILETFSSRKRNTVIYNVENAIHSAGGWILDFNSFSDTLINFVIECDHHKIHQLYQLLTGSGIEFYEYSLDQFREILNRKIKTELLISLNISFVGGEKGDLGSRIDDG